MRFRGAVTTACLAIGALVSASRPARGAECSGVVSTCINSDALWPHAGPGEFVSIGGTRTVAAEQLGFALVATYLSRPIVLQVAAPGVASGGSAQYAVDDQVNGTFLWSYGVTDRLELDLALPLTFAQGGTGLSPVTGGDGLKETAVRDIRFGFAYAVAPSPWPDRRAPAATGTEDGWGLALRFEASAPTGDADQFAGEHGAVFVPSVSASVRTGGFFAGLEAGARVRPVAELLNARIGTQLVGSLGVGFDFLPRHLLAASLEAWALPTLAAQQDLSIVDGAYVGRHNGQRIAPAEWQLALRTSPLRSGDLSIQAGGGTGFGLSGGDLPTTTPRYRFTLGLRCAVP
ncbi:MAG: hypothetical protein JOZ69_21985 [Myxococcales bacterium]|nr:hypothetical protein [Myxococcales bacterium]